MTKYLIVCTRSGQERNVITKNPHITSGTRIEVRRMGGSVLHGLNFVRYENDKFFKLNEAPTLEHVYD